MTNRWGCDGLLMSRWWAVDGPWWAVVNRANRTQSKLFHRNVKITRSWNVEKVRYDWSCIQLSCTSINNLNWWEVWYTDYLISIKRNFLIIFSTDVAAMRQWRGGFDPKWYEVVAAKVGVDHVTYKRMCSFSVIKKIA